MTPHDNELPEDHNALLLLAAGIPVMSPRVDPDAALPVQRRIDISDEASDLVGDPAVGFITHGR